MTPEDQLTLVEFKDAIDDLIEEYKKEKTHENFFQLGGNVFKQVMQSFYHSGFDDELYNSVDM